MLSMLIPILLPVLISKTYCESNETEHIFVKNNHAEANFEPGTPSTPHQEPDITAFAPTTIATTQLLIESEDSDRVIFVPNENSLVRNEDYPQDDVKIGDLMMKKTIGDVMFDKNIRLETETPVPDIVFITGKNSEHNVIQEPKKLKTEYTPRGKAKPAKPVLKLNCKDLDCNNTIKSICGEKKENGRWKNRLFMNECYFRKVNCNFKYESNRYREVELDKCANTILEITFTFKPKAMNSEKTEKVGNNARRTSSSRRSLTMGVNGQFCSHPCPVSCGDDYDPECAVSATGQKKVFVNHCKLDFNSCSYGVVWHRRPLEDCVGGKKADMRHNRNLIGWMRRAGILDKKGRLVLNT